MEGGPTARGYSNKMLCCSNAGPLSTSDGSPNVAQGHGLHDITLLLLLVTAVDDDVVVMSGTRRSCYCFRSRCSSHAAAADDDDGYPHESRAAPLSDG
mmetsp:Transcript_15444/g.33369  ORF Transcript_15444/g.33369 Transcript_15444/m.33369 type:complete len:98 (+) Transcript_15444:512-805(+)